MEIIEKMVDEKALLDLNLNNFIGETFSVDAYLSNNKFCDLSVVRKDLEYLLKNLKKFLMKLINADYNDFVKLSRNLKSTRSSLKILTLVNICIRERIEAIKQKLTQFETFINLLIAEKQNLKISRKFLKNTSLLQQYTMQLLPSEFRVGKINQRIFLEYIRQNYDKIDKNFDEKLVSSIHLFDAQEENLFKKSLDNCTQEYIYQILLANSISGNCNKAEKTLRMRFSDNISKDILPIVENRTSVENLSKFYKSLLELTSDYENKYLLSALQNNNIKTSNYFINSFWFEIDKVTQNLLHTAFSPGNPESYIALFESTENFLYEYEKFFKTKKDIKKYRATLKNNNFLQGWNLKIYFQIRYNEIAYEVEKFSRCPKNQLYTSSDKIYRTNFVDNADRMFQKCWNKGFFTKQLLPQFLKLSLQIISRIISWANEVLSLKKDSDHVNFDFLLLAYQDIILFGKNVNDYFISNNNFPPSIRKKKNLILECYEFSKNSLLDLNRIIEKKILNVLTNQICEYLKAVPDLSRMYRKTKREMPFEKSNYVSQMVESLNSFRGSSVWADKCPEDILENSIDECSERYYDCVREILISIKRTEESLKRLKSVRIKTSLNSITGDQSSIGDDEKIRKQLQIDISFWISNTEELVPGKKIKNIEKLKSSLAEIRNSEKTTLDK